MRRSTSRMLTTEASWENRAQMCRTSARDFVEALLLDVHHARYLQAHPHVRITASLHQDQILGDAEATLTRYGANAVLDRLHAEARVANLEASEGRIRSDRIEPEATVLGRLARASAGRTTRDRARSSRRIHGTRAPGRIDGSATECAVRSDGMAPASDTSAAVAGAGSAGHRPERPDPTTAQRLAGAPTALSRKAPGVVTAEEPLRPLANTSGQVGPLVHMVHCERGHQRGDRHGGGYFMIDRIDLIQDARAFREMP